MSDNSTDTLLRFSWETQPKAWGLVCEITEDCCARSAYAQDLARRMTLETGTRLVDWLDHIVLPASEPRAARIEAVGYRRDVAAGNTVVYRHDGGVFPAIVVRDAESTELVLKVDSVADFSAIHQIELPIEGESLGLYRKMRVHSSDGVAIAVAERHGYRGFDVPAFNAGKAVLRVRYAELFRSRTRNAGSDAEGFAHCGAIIDAAIAEGLSAAVVCDVFFAAEREFWMRRNRAAQVQYTRQQRLGLGWANHDHHTYRASRENFALLVGIWEKLGLIARERFYAGAEAGWGAQVMEQPDTGIITFNDVDLSPDELVSDFSHEPLRPQPALGTVGLWCALHGDSFLQAGMHHLECQFDFDALRDQLESEHSVKVMKPFTDYPHLRQAFTEGERWPVVQSRIDALSHKGLITAAQARQFQEHGALGSHLENLERNDGFKGFNQSGVSEIITATDPRRHLEV